MKKISVYIDGSVWAKFREQVFRKYGNLRKLSSEVEKILRATIIEDAVNSGFKKIGITVKGTISPREIRDKRPLLKGPPSEEILKEIADLLKSLQVDVMELRQRLDRIESSQTPSIEDSTAVLHTLRRIEEIKEEQKFRLKEKVDHLLSEAANYAIADYHINPPKHRR